jgi:hypothetical protein
VCSWGAEALGQRQETETLGAGLEDTSSWAEVEDIDSETEVEDIGFLAEADACPRERPAREAYERGTFMRCMSIKCTLLHS